MTTLLFATTLALAAGAGSPAGDSPAALPTTPHETLMASVEAVRGNDLARYIELTMPGEVAGSLRTKWDEYRAAPADPEQAQKFAEVMAVLTAPSAEDLVMGLLEPKLEEARPQLAQLSMMVQMMGGMAIQGGEGLTAQEKEEGMKVLSAVSEWLSHHDLADATLARRAVAVLCEAVRGLELASMEEVLALDYDAAMDKAGVLFGASKGVLAVYGLDVDTWLDSVRVEPVEERGDHATVRVSFTLFGIQSEVDAPMVRVDGHWLAESAVEGADQLQAAAGF